MGIFGKPNIERLKKKLNIDGLIRTLNSKDPTIRRDVCEALGELCLLSLKNEIHFDYSLVDKANDALLNTLMDKKETVDVRKEAVFALAKIRHSRSVDPLVHVLHSTEELLDLQTVATEALGKFIKSLLKDLNTHYADGRPSAADCLKKIGEQAVNPLIDFIKNVHGWTNTERNILWPCAEILGDIGDKRAIEALRATALDGPFMFDGFVDLVVRKAAAKALEKIGGPKAEEALSEYRSSLNEMEDFASDPKKQIIYVLRSKMSEKHKRRTIIKLISNQKYHSAELGKIEFCSCGYPMAVTFRNGSYGPIRYLLNGEGEAGYHIDYTCPSCGKLVYSEQL